jgi:hypothetical protein
MRRRIGNAIRQKVEGRAQGRCEYCRLPQLHYVSRFQNDHVVSLKHGGKSDLSNLALACVSCNARKGSDITSIDPITGLHALLFNPRIHEWGRHFEIDFYSGKITGTTSEGRATVELLKFNTTERIEERFILIEQNEF